MDKIESDFSALKETDIYSLILFVLSQLSGEPDYAVLSEMVYILDKESMLKLCEYFGGMTLKIPTIDELESIVYALVMYEHIDIKKKSYEETINMIKEKSSNLKSIKSDYLNLKQVLMKYDFKPRQDT